MTTEYDVLVLGAGASGVYAVHKFRNELGLRVKGLEPAQGPGGVWYWNRYPGARVDFPSVYYSYSFSPEIGREWKWSEKYASQPELLRYFEFVVDRLGIRDTWDWGVSATSLNWDDVAKHWVVPTSDGRTLTARFVIAGTGGLSEVKKPEFPGRERFRGEYLTSREWPETPVSFEGKRVVVIGTGSSGIQIIQSVAPTAAQLTVLQRTPNFATPMRNVVYTPEEQEWNAAHHAELWAAASPITGADFGQIRPSVFADDPAEVRRRFDEFYFENGGLGFAFSNYADLLYDPKANEVISDYIREQIRVRVHDPEKAELLTPKDHPYTTKRPPLETDYFEVYNRANVDLVDVLADPIAEVTETGIRLVSGLEIECDMIITALGFDAFTGAQLALPMTGRGGVTLQQYWQDGPLDYLGMAIHDFPNYFQIGVGPSAASLTNNFRITEEQLDFAAALVQETLRRGAQTIEPSAEADAEWKRLCDGIMPFTLYPRARSSWYLGQNIPGKKPVAYVFYAGTPMYRAILRHIEHRGLGGFELDGVQQGALPPLVRLSGGAANFVGGMMMSGQEDLARIPLEVMRAMADGQGAMQVPGPELPSVEVPVGAARVRIYRPETTSSLEDAALPVLITFHGGGFAAGGLETIAPTCRRLAAELGAVVVDVDYRLAPEAPFPAAVTDADDALAWVRCHIAEHGGDPGRIALLGESAGANLVAVLARHAVEAGEWLAAQVLINPVTDGEAATASKREFADGPFLSVAAGDRFWRWYVGDATVTPDAAPLRAEDLRGQAGALVATMGIDPLRDEGEQYAERLIEAGVEVTRRRFDGLIHSTFNFSAMIPEAGAIHVAIVDHLRAHLGADVGRPATLVEVEA